MSSETWTMLFLILCVLSWLGGSMYSTYCDFKREVASIEHRAQSDREFLAVIEKRFAIYEEHLKMALEIIKLQQDRDINNENN
ncbi:hypothetical protein CCAL9344_08970 [Campylobacter sp. RM9344]|uniref:Phage protein n=1 Tax=Campylobacter californiensis TaxID=1032243 RepID=A0AAW3ZYH4_9BACT|nr:MULTISPECIES: hypothetical protein [unclassified Campylobacter]MBE2985317.1 hypothetical protein [Campylobacter sp. RM6883]MBE2995850.1 hypothetical protein [Campylobacter sp. RM6913]MBE3030307.1 hypothetical protein [Campylobacter sp. RM9344]MBE3608733.1 hypothetical protein [Campylobacter sp. RM9337]QCD51257.1 hypothetical protein CCAL_1372 [Campylobacter sp. RM6914]